MVGPERHADSTVREERLGTCGQLRAEVFMCPVNSSTAAPRGDRDRLWARGSGQRPVWWTCCRPGCIRLPRSAPCHRTAMPSTGGLTRSAEHGLDRGPALSVISRCVDSRAELPLDAGPALECDAGAPEQLRIANVRVVGLMIFELLRQPLGLVDDVLCRSRHSAHFRYLGRTCVACTMTGWLDVTMTPISSNFRLCLARRTSKARRRDPRRRWDGYRHGERPRHRAHACEHSQR
jgi:hypothetical protein